MSRTEKRKSTTTMTFRKICRDYDIADSTLRLWVSSEVFGLESEIKKVKIRGRDTQVFNKKQIERLEKFLKFREILGAAAGNDVGPIDPVISILDAIEENNYEAPIQILEEALSTINDIREVAEGELKSLYEKAEKVDE
jgi:hypothetical protein